MTIISGVRLMRAPCCGRIFSFPNYRSMNFSAFEYWTDGWSDGALMPVGEGVRICTCGSLFLNRACTLVEVTEASDIAYADWAGPDDFRKQIIDGGDHDLMLAVRLDLWRHLNHPYRHEYRTHRDNEEAAIEAEWQEANPDCRTWWDKLLRKKPPAYRRPQDRPITFPPFCATAEQLENMAALTGLLSTLPESQRNNLLLAELFREQGRMEEAKGAMSLAKPDDDPTRQLVLRTSLGQCQNMPIRFRY